MPRTRRNVFISSSRDLQGWAALAVTHVRDFAQRFGLVDLDVFDYRDVDPAEVDHGASWQDNVGAPSALGAALTIVLIGERLGTPLPETFRMRDSIRRRLLGKLYDWVHVAGSDPATIGPGEVPLTGVLFEFFDAFLPRDDGLAAAPMRVIFKGTDDGSGEPNFGNGAWRAAIEHGPGSPRAKRQMRKAYDQQLDWLFTFWERIYGRGQHACVFCENDEAFVEQLERSLMATFLSGASEEGALARAGRDSLTIELPGPAPYDLDRAAFYHGRGPQVAELSRRALQHGETRRLVPVLGESGAGKSSLLRAGLLREVRSPERVRFGWRSCLVSLTDKKIGQSPVAFLAETLCAAEALPELGPAAVLHQRLEGTSPGEAARRLLEAIASAPVGREGKLGEPKLLLVVDQFEIALDAVHAKVPDEEWRALLDVLGTLGNGLLTPGTRERLDELGLAIGARVATSVVVGLPADRVGALSALLRPGDHMFHLPRLVDETALRQIVTGTFAALGLRVRAAAREALCRDAVQLAVGTEASILPMLAVTLAALHDGWKARQDKAEEDFCAGAGELADITLEDVERKGTLEQAIERLGVLAWQAAEANDTALTAVIRRLPISVLRLQAERGEITARDFALARLLRRLVVVSGDDAAPDRLTGLPDDELDEATRPLAEALRRHRLLTRHDDGTWWLVHLAVLRGWARASAWRAAELETFRTMAAMAFDERRWRDAVAAGEADAERWLLLWTREREMEQALDWMGMRGAEDRPELAAFAQAATVAAVRQDGARAGRILRAASFFDKTAWCLDVLAAARHTGHAAVNTISSDGSVSALHTACLHGNAEVVEALLHDGADPNLSLADETRPLRNAAGAGALEVCHLLLALGALVDAETNEGWTALAAAASAGHVAVVATLLKGGASVNTETNEGWTALAAAASAGHVAVVATLLEVRPSVDTVTKSGVTALMAAADGGHRLIVEALLDAGAAVDLTAENGLTALSFAAAGGHDAVVARLVAAAAMADPVAKDGRSPLLLAAENGHLAVVDRLIELGADVNRQASDGRTATSLAVLRGHVEVLERLIAAKADLDRRDDIGRTALAVAAKLARVDCVRHLLEAGAALEVPNNDGCTPLSLAAQHGDLVTFELLRRAGAQLNVMDVHGRTPFLHAVREEAIAIVRELIAAGVDRTVREENGHSALILAARNKDAAMTRLLIESGADMEARNKAGRSALEIATMQHARSVVAILRASGAAPLTEPELEEISHRSVDGQIELGILKTGELILLTEVKLRADVEWIGYDWEQRSLKLFFEIGGSVTMAHRLPDEADGRLRQATKITIIEPARGKLFGYDTPLRRTRNGVVVA